MNLLKTDSSAEAYFVAISDMANSAPDIFLLSLLYSGTNLDI